MKEDPAASTEPSPDFASPRVVIRVFGVGGGGCNALDNMVAAGLEGAEFIACNTDVKSLARCRAGRTVHLGRETTRGLGAGARPDVGRAAAEEAREEIRQAAEGADLVFVAAGMGGGTGTGAAPVVAEIARACGCLTVAVVTRPFRFEGRRRAAHAEEGIARLEAAADTVLIIPNDRLLTRLDAGVTMLDAFRRADAVLLHAVRSITDLVQAHGYINVDYADARAVMAGRGAALMAAGEAKGPSRALEAVEGALASPLLENNSIAGATALLVNVSGPRDFSVQELDAAMTRLRDAVDAEAEIILGVRFTEELDGPVRATIIATGMGSAQKAGGRRLSGRG